MRQCTAAEITPLASLTFKSMFLRRECKEIHLGRFSNKRQQSLSNQPTFRHATTGLYPTIEKGSTLVAEQTFGF